MNTTPQRRSLEVAMALPIRTYDIDFAGVVSNIVYVRWLEDLRLEMLARFLPLNELLKERIAPVVVQTKIDYKRPIKIVDQASGKVWIKTLERSRWTVNAEITVNDQIAALAEQVGIFVDLQTYKPIRIPESLRQKYDQP